MAVEQASVYGTNYRTDGFYADCSIYAELNGFSRVVVFEQPVDVYDHGSLAEQYQFLFAETLHTDHWVDVAALKPTDAVAENGWRVYYQAEERGETVQEAEQKTQVTELIGGGQWFSVRAGGVGAVGVYFPSELKNDERKLAELIKAVDAYFIATGAVVGVPRGKDIHVHPEEVVNAWSGVPESGVDFLLYKPGFARINGMSIDRGDPVYKPLEVTSSIPESAELTAVV